MQRRAAHALGLLARRTSDTACDTPRLMARLVSSSCRTDPGLLKKHTFRVEANYLGSTINVYDLVKLDQFKDNFKTVHKGAALISFGGGNGSSGADQDKASAASEASASNPTTHAEPNEERTKHTKHTKEAKRATVPSTSATDSAANENSFMAVTSYGSAVFFDTPKELKDRCLSLLLNKNASVVSEALKDHTLYKEEFEVTIDPSIAPRWSILENPDCIVLQTMDVKHMQTVSHVLAQSVALDFYSTHVEKTLETFCSLNLEMMDSGNISNLNKQILLQLVRNGRRTKGEGRRRGRVKGAAARRSPLAAHSRAHSCPSSAGGRE